MSSLRITLLLLIGTSLQTLLPGPAALGSNNWPILLGLVLCISLKSDRAHVLYAGLLAGLLHDAFSPAPLGVSIPFFLLMGWGVYALRKKIFGDQIITYLALGFLGALCKTIYFTLIFAGFGLRPVGAGSFVVQLLGSLLLGTITTSLLFLLLSALPFKKTRRSSWGVA